MCHHVGKEDWRWRFWRDLRGRRPRHEGDRGDEARVGEAVEAGAEDGGGRPEEASGSVLPRCPCAVITFFILQLDFFLVEKTKYKFS